MNDAILTYHRNPFGCGVAKFNVQLSQKLGIPCGGFTMTAALPLVSIKPSEIPAHEFPQFSSPYDLFLHDWQDTSRNRLWLRDARKVYAGNEVIWRQVQELQTDAQLAWCPATVTGNGTRGTFSVLLFGMGHKVRPQRLEQLKALLTGRDYTVHVSTAVHEGNPWDEAFSATETTLRAVFGDRLRLLGYLADDGLVEQLRRCHVAALFFDPAARANNTTLWAAMEQRAAVITNLDEHSPSELVHGETVLDIDRTTNLLGWSLDALGYRAARAVTGKSWEALLQVLR